jgi:glycosyltransferase involved in cell wall biosynthesis
MIETGGPGGAEHVVISLAVALRESGVATASVALFEEGWLSAHLRSRQVPVHVLSLDRVIDFRLLSTLVRLVRREHVALIHAHEFAANLYAALAGRFAGIPVVATVHGKNYYTEARRRVIAMRALRRLGAAVVAVSDDLKSFLEREVGLRGVRVAPNGIDVDRYDPGARDRVRSELGIGVGETVVGAVGNLYPVKGHKVLIEAVGRMSHPVRLLIAGRGGEEAALRKCAADMGVSDRVHLLGFREDVPRLLSAFDVYALPSFSEGQSLALMEAMAAGLPIVASRVGGNPEIIDDGEHGLLVEAGDAAALAACLTRLAQDTRLRCRLAANARSRVRAEFSLEAMATRYRGLYHEALVPWSGGL